MSSPQVIELSAIEASEQIRQMLEDAKHAVHNSDLEATLDAFVRALGLALQFGPAATERVLAETLAAAGDMAKKRDADALSVLGPALIGLTNQVREADALPATSVMEGWAAVSSDLGALLGQLGLVLSMSGTSSKGMLANASRRAQFLDDMTHGCFGLVDWLDGIGGALLED